MKKILLGQDARDKLLEGAKLMHDTVGITYSPAGQNVAFGRQWGTPKVVHDGVTVSKEVESPDEFIQMGIDIIREAAQNQVSEAGDGTTLTTILSYHIVEKSNELIKKGANPMLLRKQILKALPEVISAITKQSQDVKTREQLKHVAMVSSDDAEIAEAVTAAVEKVGADGLITVEFNKRQIIETEYTEGMELDRGYGQYPHFVTNPDRMEAVVEDASVLVLGRKVTLVDEIMPLIQAVIGTGSKSLFIVGEVSGDALTTLIVNKIKGNINALVVAAPGYGDFRKDTLEDIAILTGATVVVDEIGMKKEDFINSFNKSWIGTTKKVIATRATTNIIRYEESDFKTDDQKKAIKVRNERIKERIEKLQVAKKEADNVYDREKLQERLARLTTGMAVIKVGAASEVERDEKMERVKDAVPAAQAARDGGIVIGGGMALLRASRALYKTGMNEGEKLLYDVLREPIKKILENAGVDNKTIDKKIEEIDGRGGNYGYNVLTEKIEDLIKAGVIDPTKVISNALENSVSVATTLLTTNAAIAIERQEVKTDMTMA